MTTLTEADVEHAALDLLAAQGWRVAHGPDVAPGAPAAERDDYGQVVLERRLRDALAELNAALPASALDDAIRRLTRTEGATLEARNRAFHRMLVNGVEIEYRDVDGSVRGDSVAVLDFDNPACNDWLAVNQFTVTENRNTRRLDVVLFVNGLPLGVIELKNPTDEDATIWSAWQQLQTYKSELPALFSMNEALMVSDGNEARVGTLTAGREWFKPWRTVTGETLADPFTTELQVMLEGVFEPGRFLALVRDFIVFDDDGSGALVKKMAGYHQYHAVRVAVGETMRAARLQRSDGAVADPGGRYESGRTPGGEHGDRRIGVVWHTQGSGKSLTMAFYAGAIIREPAMENPTIVVLTDRNDLDDQLFGTFSRCQDLLRQPPTQADSRADLRSKLSVNAGGVVFTTIQKFFPEQQSGDTRPALSDRRNIVVIADEAHRSQYDFVDGFARHMRDALPSASFVGLTGTPIELRDANTRAVFGDYISIYDVQRSALDQATGAHLLREPARPAGTGRGRETEDRPGLRGGHRGRGGGAQGAAQDQVGAARGGRRRGEPRAPDRRGRRDPLRAATPGLGGQGDGGVHEPTHLRRVVPGVGAPSPQLARRRRPRRPEGGDDRLRSDPLDWQPHVGNKARREALAQRFRDPADPLKMVLVRDMWLTGFDAPSLHTMYVDKPMRGHGLMQAIARVNRVFGDKPGGLVVDYLGLAQELKQAVATYTDSGGAGRATLNQEEAVAVMLEKHEVCCALFHGFDWSKWTTGNAQERLGLLAAVRELSQAFALAVPHPETTRIRDDVGFFQAVRAALSKSATEARTDEDLDLAVRQIISRAVASEGVMDIFAAAGLDKPDISVLSDEFLAEVQGMPHLNLAVELLQKLLRGEVSARRRTNVVQARSFAEMLEQTLRRYQNRAIEAAQVIEELIALAKDMREANARGERLGLSEDELAFYDALETNDSAVQVLGDDTLRDIARELVDTVRSNVTIDWTVRENVRANLRRMVRRVLRKHGYPPDKQEKATRTVLEQAEALSEGWSVV